MSGSGLSDTSDAGSSVSAPAKSTFQPRACGARRWSTVSCFARRRAATAKGGGERTSMSPTRPDSMSWRGPVCAQPRNRARSAPYLAQLGPRDRGTRGGERTSTPGRGCPPLQDAREDVSASGQGWALERWRSGGAVPSERASGNSRERGAHEADGGLGGLEVAVLVRGLLLRLAEGHGAAAEGDGEGRRRGLEAPSKTASRRASPTLQIS